MELPDLGKQCEEPSCKQLDFLPIHCKHCEKIFCKNHSSLLGHNCPSQKANTLNELPQKVAKVENQKEVPICNLDQCDQIVVTTCPRFLDSDLIRKNCDPPNFNLPCELIA